SDNKIAIGLVVGILARIIFIITIIGTDKSIQRIHQIIHQKAREVIITKGLKFNLFPINCGSKTCHTSNSTHDKSPNRNKES
ncbi:MAG: hypothetical protein LBQ59_02385, partial [Candidatus Peribacteria bacterium]|nr:hypothetical protein [Candidatus Peribacteria bacterium]